MDLYEMKTDMGLEIHSVHTAAKGFFHSVILTRVKPTLKLNNK